jgi:hypothetical protein
MFVAAEHARAAKMFWSGPEQPELTQDGDEFRALPVEV